VHLPKFSLETGGFRGLRGFASMLMSRKWKISKNDAQARVVFSQQFLSKPGELPARRTLEIGELFQRNRGFGITSNVRRSIASSGNTLAFGNALKLRTLCAIEHRAAPKRDQCDTNYNYKRQVTFHARDKRRILDATIASSSASPVKISLCALESLAITRRREYSAQCDFASC